MFYEDAEGESFKTKFTHRPIGRSWLMLPQKFETKVVVDYSYRRPDDTGLDAKLGTRSLETQLQPGKHYIYDITVDIDDVNFKLEIIEERLNK